MDTKKLLGKSILDSMAGRYSVYLVQLISMMVMARLFTPEEFGVFAAIQVVVIFILLFSEMGFGPAIINLETIGKAQRNGIFTATVLLGFIFLIILYVTSPLIASFYNNDIYTLLVRVISISIVFSTACVVPMAILQRERKFKLIAAIDVLSEVISLSSVFCLVTYFDSVTVLSIKPVVFSVVRLPLLMYACKKTEVGIPFLGNEPNQILSIIGFSKYQFGFNLLNFFSRNLDNVLVAKNFGATSLGIYDKAYQIMKYPLLLLTFALSPAIQPVLKNIAHDKEEIGHIYLDLILKLVYISSFISILIILFADEIVFLLLGDGWKGVSVLISILALSVPIQVVLSSTGGVFRATNHPKIMLYCGLFSSVCNVIFMIVGILTGDLKQLCMLLVISFSINFVQCFYSMFKYVISCSTKKLYYTVLPPVTVVFIVYYLQNIY